MASIAGNEQEDAVETCAAGIALRQIASLKKHLQAVKDAQAQKSIERDDPQLEIYNKQITQLCHEVESHKLRVRELEAAVQMPSQEGLRNAALEAEVVYLKSQEIQQGFRNGELEAEVADLKSREVVYLSRIAELEQEAVESADAARRKAADVEPLRAQVEQLIAKDTADVWAATRIEELEQQNAELARRADKNDELENLLHTLQREQEHRIAQIRTLEEKSQDYAYKNAGLNVVCQNYRMQIERLEADAEEAKKQRDTREWDSTLGAIAHSHSKQFLVTEVSSQKTLQTQGNGIEGDFGRTTPLDSPVSVTRSARRRSSFSDLAEQAQALMEANTKRTNMPLPNDTPTEPMMYAPSIATQAMTTTPRLETRSTLTTQLGMTPPPRGGYHQAPTPIKSDRKIDKLDTSVDVYGRPPTQLIVTAQPSPLHLNAVPSSFALANGGRPSMQAFVEKPIDSRGWNTNTYSTPSARQVPLYVQ